MSIGDRLHDLLTPDASDGDEAVEGPAAASGAVGSESEGSEGDREQSAAGSGRHGSETSEGGADAVPDTPDGVVENYT